MSRPSPQEGVSEYTWLCLYRFQRLMSSIVSQQPFQAGSKYEPHCFPQRISHFDPSVNGTFCQRYWLDASSYKEGGPVYVLDGGETSGANR